MTTTEPTTTRVTASLDVLLALCCVCGTTRTVSRRAIAGRAGNRTLRCETCRKTTPHAAVGGDRFDWREDLDHAKPPTLTVADKLDVLRALGARVEEDTEPEIIATVYHYLDDDSFCVDFNPDANPAHLANTLTEIIERVTKPSDTTWYVGVDDDGLVYASIAWIKPLTAV